MATLEAGGNEYGKPAPATVAIESTEEIETIAARMCMMSSAQVALVTIALDFVQDGRMSGSRSTLANQSAHYYLENLRPLVRKTDSVFLLRHTFYFILAGANLQGGGIVQERLWDALLWRVNNTFDGDYLRPHKITIGYSSCITQFIDVYKCIDVAREPKQSFHVHSEKSARRASAIRDAELPEMARKLGIPYVSFLPRKLPARIQRLINPTLAQELRCFPIGRDRDILSVAMSNPQDLRALDRLRKETGLTIFPVLAHPCELQTALEQFY